MLGSFIWTLKWFPFASEITVHLWINEWSWRQLLDVCCVLESSAIFYSVLTIVLTDKVMWEMLRSWFLSTYFKISPVWLISDLVNVFFTQYILLVYDYSCPMWLEVLGKGCLLLPSLKKKGRKNQIIVQPTKAWKVVHCHLDSRMYLGCNSSQYML